jgi:hypothetical protein
MQIIVRENKKESEKNFSKYFFCCDKKEKERKFKKLPLVLMQQNYLKHIASFSITFRLISCART